MRRAWAVTAVAAVGVVGIATATAAVAGASTLHTPAWVLRRAPAQVGGQASLLSRYGAVQNTTSTNWAGYIATGQSFTKATGAWYQPKPTCTPGKTGNSSYWVGIGGYGDTPTIEQTGTESDCQANGQPVYFAWYELYPLPSVEVVNFAVRPGDAIGATVSNSGSTVTIQMKNYTTGQTFSTTKQFNGVRSSAEWVVEAPSSYTGVGQLPLDQFGGTFLWGNAAAGGQLEPISNFNTVKMTMTNNVGVPVVQVSPLVNGSIFAAQRVGPEHP